MKLSAKSIATTVIGIVVAFHLFLGALTLIVSVGFLAPLLVLVACDIVWLIASCCRRVMPDEVALRDYFGELDEEEVLEPGLHFLPLFPGVRLRRIPSEQILLTFKMDPRATTGSVMSGNMLGLRSGDVPPQKLFVEATVFWCPPHKKPELLALLIKSGVPFNNKRKLEHWMRNAVVPDMNYVFGQRKYLEVVGGQLNHELNVEINRRLRGEFVPGNRVLNKVDSLLERSGLISPIVNNVLPGDGEFTLEVENVHVQGPLGAKMEEVETSRLKAEAERSSAEVGIKTAVLQAEAQRQAAEVGIKTATLRAEAQREAARIGIETARSTAKSKAEIISGTTEIMFQQWFDAETRRLGIALSANPSPEEKAAYAVAIATFRTSDSYVRKEKEVDELRKLEMSGEGSYKAEKVDVQSGGKPVGAGMAGTIGTASVVAGAIAEAIVDAVRGKKKGGGPKHKQGPMPTPPVPTGNPADDDDDDDEAVFRGI